MNADSVLSSKPGQTAYLLGIDTCGPSGSVALGRVSGATGVEILAQAELEGRTYSATLISAVETVLGEGRIGLPDLSCLVVVHGPGSFTGVRVGLSAVKGLAEPTEIPVIALSRLEILAWKAGVFSAALDAHRREVFLRLAEPGLPSRESLAGPAELAGITPPRQIAVCDESAAALVGAAWPSTNLMQVPAPTAADALQLAVRSIQEGDFADLALLDGHYLRRSDAEIFGPPPVRAG